MARIDPGTPQVEIKLFGTPSVLVGGEDITSSLSKRSIWLIAMLSLSQSKSVSRHYAAGALWPDSSDSAALYNLRQTLASIRRSFGEAKDVVTGTSKTVDLRVDPDVSIDILDFDLASKGVDGDALERALSLYRGEFLRGCDEPFAIVAREQKEHAFLLASENLVAHYLSSGNAQLAIPVLRRVLVEDPYRETSCRSLMYALAEVGEWPAALDFYREFRRRLRRELNTEVSAETKAAYRSVRMRSLDGKEVKESKDHIPIPLTDLVGRLTEIDTVVSLLERCRLVTLCGAGGVGKTRLAIAVADRISSKYLDGAYFIDLAPIRDSQTILATLATSLQVKEVAGKTQLESVSDHLAERDLLLVLDNCEHLTDEVARLSEKLLSSGHGLHLLATSRQTVGVRGEFVWNVPALSLPKVSDSPEKIVATESARLFLDRYRRDSNGLAEAEIRAIGSICRRLDGLPLAIELAAARTNVLTAVDLEKRLDQKFALLTGGSQQLQRHQTLKACMEWSWDLLSEEERDLLKTLSVFRGGCNLEAIEAVSSVAGDQLDQLSSLIDRSLVNSYTEGHQTRYSMLETVREFAAEILEKDGKSDLAQERHRNYFLNLLEEHYPHLLKKDEAKRFKEYEIDHDNFRAAIDYSHHRKHSSECIRLCCALGRFWDTHGHLNEGRAQFDRALPLMPEDLDSVYRSRAYVHAGWIAYVQRDHRYAIELYEKALVLNQERNDVHATAVANSCIGSAYRALREFATAEKYFIEAIAVRSKLDFVGESPMLTANLADIATAQGDYKKARTLIEAALTALGGPKEDRTQVSGMILCHLAFIDYADKRYDDALSNAMRGFEFLDSGGQIVNQPFALAIISLAEGGLGRWESAVRTMALSEKMDSKQGTTPLDYIAAALGDLKKNSRAVLGERAFDMACEEGKSMEPSSCISLISRGTVLV